MRQDDVTVSAADIARLADVGRAAVSNWRKRFDDFPQPVGGTASSPAFSLADIEEWLRRHDRYVEVAPLERVWQRLRATNDDLRLGDAVGYVGALLLYIQGDPAGWPRLAGLADDQLLARLPVRVPAGVAIDAGLIRVIAEVGLTQGPVDAFDVICERYVESHSRRLLATPLNVAQLMVRIGATAGARMLDPACGIGTLLLASDASRVFGQELNETAARLTAVRLRLHGLRATIKSGDSLRADAFPAERVDAVVCNPPFNDRTWGYEDLTYDVRWEYGLPPRGESELAWVQHCLAHVRPGGLVVIMMPGVAASRRAGRRVRGNLLRAGALRAVITLSTGAAPASSGAPDLWVLRRPETGDPPLSEVLMVNAGADLSLAEQAWQAFSTGGQLPGGSRTVRIIDLLDEEIDLATGHRLAIQEHVDSAGFAALRQKVVSLAKAVLADIPRLTEAEHREVPMTNLGELSRAGVVAILQGPLKLSPEGDRPVLTAKDLLLGRPCTGRTEDIPGLITVAAGDVVAPLVTGGESAPRVMTESGAALGERLLLIRADPDRLDPHFLAGCLRAASGSSVRRGSSMRLDPRRAQLPRLPIEEQRRYGEAYRRLLAFEDTSRALREINDKLVAAGFDGLFDGTLRPE
ncbi:N-6 DNA methylase [Acrocarpospora catenulata]|uniref:N-6 DNA methylase n=1 Tax=Acrocarpospora catenulata TaxID=2836182 RepID=UPI001BD95F1F|nr:N-6 DNA methylase [Acrocarpospora catenulata]